MQYKIIFLTVILSLFLTACNNASDKKTNSTTTEHTTETTDTSEITDESMPELPFEMTFKNGDELSIIDAENGDGHYDVSISFAEDDIDSNIDFLIRTINMTSDDFKANIAYFSCYDKNNDCICMFTMINPNGKMEYSSGVWYNNDYEDEFNIRYK